VETKRFDDKIDPKAKGKKTAESDFDLTAMGFMAACPRLAIRTHLVRQRSSPTPIGDVGWIGWQKSSSE
jgi:hypothetical protein